MNEWVYEVKISLAFVDQSIILKCYFWIWNENEELGTQKIGD